MASTDVNSSIDHIEDPEEYFLAFEKLESSPLTFLVAVLSVSTYIILYGRYLL